MKTKLYQIHILLKDSKPSIWRRILIPSDYLLSDFHLAIQASMDWYDMHLHQFIKDKIMYCPKSPDIIDFWDDSDMVDYDKMKISDLLINEKDKIKYEYDFGDGWEHYITLEKFISIDGKMPFPVCIKGKMNCPPEDSHGMWGYYHMLDVLQHPDHEEFEEISEWLGEDFDSTFFDIYEINSNLISYFLDVPEEIT